jgi:hypothetical protein
MPIVGPIIPKNNNTENTLPFVNSFPNDQNLPILAGEIASNIVDGRLWLRKQIDTTRGPSGVWAYNFEQIGGPYVITEKTSGYTLQPQDTGIILEMNVGTAATLTIPSYTGNNSVPFIRGTEIKILLTNTGPVNITGASGVTLNSKNGFNLTSQWDMATLIKRDTDSWVIIGDLT